MEQERKIRVHVIMDESDRSVIEAIKNIKGVEVTQWDYSFDTAFQWTVHNEAEEIDVFLASEYAQISTVTNDGKPLNRDTALLRRVKDIFLMRPKTKFVLFCDEDRDLPENRHFLANLVSIGIYDFRTQTQFNSDSLKQILTEPKRDITHIQAYLPENVQVAKPFEKQPQKEKEEAKAVDIFATIKKFRREDDGEKRKPKVKHIIEKVRPSVVSFIAFGPSDGNTSLLASTFATMLAEKDAKVALVELHGTGIPRLGFGTGIRSRQKAIETAMQRIEDEEDILGLLINPKEAISTTPNYEAAILDKLKALPQTLHILAGKDTTMPNSHPFKSIKGSTLDAAPGEIVNQLIFRHGFDSVVFAISGSLSTKLAFHALKASNTIYCVTDQHPAHISWLRQNFTIMSKIGIPDKNLRTAVYPYYELSNIRLSDIEVALGQDVDYVLPDVTQELFDIAWGKGRITNADFLKGMAEMIRESTGYKLDTLEAKAKRKISLPGLFAAKQKKDDATAEEAAN